MYVRIVVCCMLCMLCLCAMDEWIYISLSRGFVWFGFV